MYFFPIESSFLNIEMDGNSFLENSWRELHIFSRKYVHIIITETSHSRKLILSSAKQITK